MTHAHKALGRGHVTCTDVTAGDFEGGCIFGGGEILNEKLYFEEISKIANFKKRK